LGGAANALALGAEASTAPAVELRRKCKVDYNVLGLPIGVAATDEYVTALSKFSHEPVPEEIETERGQVVDIMLDSYQYFDKKRVAIYGDPDTVLGLTSLVLELGMVPCYTLTGTPAPSFVTQMKALFEHYGVSDLCWVKDSCDLFELHQHIIQKPVDLLLGTSMGKQIAKAEDIPLVRAGFPIIDRYVHSYMPLVGYRGAMRLIERIGDAIMDRMDRDSADEDFEMVM
jgi:nitrogenase molybdenum-iron protein beta chain